LGKIEISSKKYFKTSSLDNSALLRLGDPSVLVEQEWGLEAILLDGIVT